MGFWKNLGAREMALLEQIWLTIVSFPCLGCWLLWTELCPPEIHMIKALTPQWDGVWRRACGKYLGLVEVTRVGLWDPYGGNSALVRGYITGLAL